MFTVDVKQQYNNNNNNCQPFVANQLIVKSVKVESALFTFCIDGNCCRDGFCQYSKAVMVRCINKQSAVAEMVYIVVKWAVNLRSKHAGYGSELFLKFGEDLYTVKHIIFNALFNCIFFV